MRIMQYWARVSAGVYERKRVTADADEFKEEISKATFFVNAEYGFSERYIHITGASQVSMHVY